jgi:hypothetical protein
MIEPNRRTRRVQSSKFLHPTRFTYSNDYQGHHPSNSKYPPKFSEE